MTAATSRLRRRGIGAGVAALVGLAGLSGTAVAAPGFALDRVGGADRFETAALAAAEFPNTTSVVLVNAFSNVDALAAASLGLPVLFTRQDVIPATTLDALAALGVQNITIVGGTAVVDQEIEDTLAATYVVDRLAGADRYATAASVAGELDPAAPYVFVANGLTGVADALSASTAAAATGSPILLVREDAVPTVTDTAVGAFTGAQVVAVGGTAVISADVATDLGVDARAEGTDRFGTAADFADWTIAAGVFDGTTAGIARGIGTGDLGPNDLADALVAGPVLGGSGGPLLLSRTATDLGATTSAWFEANAANLTIPGWIFGGETAVAAAVVTAALEAAAAAGGGGGDTTAPTVAITSPAADAGSVDAATFDITGTTEAGATVTVYAADGTTVVGTTTAAADTGAFTVTVTLAQGATNTFQVTATDAANNESAATTVTIVEAAADATAPTAVDADTSLTSAGMLGDAQTLSVVFDENVVATAGGTVVVDADGDPGTTGDQETLTLADTATADAAGEVTFSVAGMTLTVTANATTAAAQTITPGTSRIITVTGVADEATNAFAGAGLPQIIVNE